MLIAVGFLRSGIKRRFRRIHDIKKPINKNENESSGEQEEQRRSKLHLRTPLRFEEILKVARTLHISMLKTRYFNMAI